MTYEEWKAARLERVVGRCGGNPTFRGTRLQPHDIIITDLDDPADMKNAEMWGFDREDVVYSKQFATEEPHWKILSQGKDLHGRDVPEEEYEALYQRYRLGWDGL
jgi:uncharacterized protein (DUF433 family)